MLSDFGQFLPLDLIQDFTVITLTCDVNTEDDSLVHHLVEVNGSTNVLWHLGLGVDQKVPSNVHEFDQRGEIFLDGTVVHDYQSRALLGTDALFRVIET